MTLLFGFVFWTNYQIIKSYSLSPEHQLYQVTTWDEAHATEAARPEMDEALRRTMIDFYAPFNERLFELAGGRCRWPTSTRSSTDVE